MIHYRVLDVQMMKPKAKILNRIVVIFSSYQHLSVAS